MRKRYFILLLLTLLSVITYLDRLCIAVAGPSMQKDLELDPEQWDWVLGAFTLTYALFEIPSGAWGDTFGRRNVIALENPGDGQATSRPATTLGES